MPVENRDLVKAPEENFEEPQVERTEEIFQPGKDEVSEEQIEGAEEPEEFCRTDEPRAEEEFAGKDGILPEGEADILEETQTRPVGANERAYKQMVTVPPDEIFVIDFGELPVGTRLGGHLKEADGDIFDYQVVDEENYTAYNNDEDVESLDEGSDGTSYELEVGIGEPGRYYLLISNRSIQDPKDIHVDLRLKFP
jgi:hypothetical protein